MAVSYGAAVAASAKTVVDTSIDSGAASVGINFGLNNVAGSAAGTDEASIGASRLGGSPGATVKVESGDGVGV